MSPQEKNRQSLPPDTSIALPTSKDMKTIQNADRRRFLLGISAIALGAIPTARALSDFALMMHQTIDNPYKEFILVPNFRTFDVVSKNTEYTESNLQHTDSYVFGDSIARGEQERKPKEQWYAAMDVIVNEMRSKGFQWWWDNEATNGSTTDDVIRQIDNTGFRNPSTNIDILLSAGGNNVIRAVKDNLPYEKLSSIQNATQLRITEMQKLISAVESSLVGFDVNFFSMLQRLHMLHDNGINLQRVFIIGIPNMSHSTEATFNQRDGTPVTISVPDNPTVRKLVADITRHVSLFLNYAIAKACHIAQSNVAYDIIMINTFDLLNQEDFSGIHPNEHGQDKIAHEILKRSIAYTSPEKTRSLYDMLNR